MRTVAPALLLATLCASTTAQDTPPNFVIVFADDLGYGDLGCYGNEVIRTPNVDRMAAEGLRFTNFYAQTVCGPSRAALMTGSHPMRVARRHNRMDIHPRLHPEEITLAELLKTRGYATGCYGKWDLAGHSQTDYDPELLPLHQGFDEFFGTPTSNDRVVHLVRGNEIVEHDVDMAELTRRYTDAALDFIRRHRDEPFFVYIPHTMPHTKLGASADFAGRSERGLYGDVVEELDANTGRILDLIDELGLDERTWVVFLSDNGPWWIQRQHGGSAGELRGAKTSAWEGGVRVPCVIRAPGRIAAGKVTDRVATSMDLFPTIARLAGAELPEDRVLDGVDVSPLLAGEPARDDERTVLHYVHTHLQALRHGRFKLHLPRPVQPPWTPKWSGHIPPADRIAIDTPLLFDLLDDPGETTDVATKHPEVVAELLALAEAARADLDHLGAGQRFFDPEPQRPDVRDDR